MPIAKVNSGDIITSTAWNSLVDEINLKVNRAGDNMTGPLSIRGGNGVLANSLQITDPATNTVFKDNWIGMANNIEGATKWLHIGGITDTDNVRRIALVANRIQIAGNLSFGTRTGQLINLWGTEYGIGVQSNTQYFRSFAHFGWHRGGVHSDGQLDAGAGGTRLMYLNNGGELAVSGAVHLQNSDIYFTKTDHVHSGTGNTNGFAAIENSAAPYNALMILGRSIGTNGRRFIQMWDDVDIAGRLRPSAGGGELNGIIFPLNAFGGAGDRASIQYVNKAGGESTTLEIKILNDADDNIEFIASGKVISSPMVTPSDERLKKNIEPLKYGLEQIKKLFPVSYDWKDRISRKKNIGLLAQNVETVINEAVYENKKDANYTELNLSYDTLIPVLINAVKELDQKLEAVQLQFAPKI